MMASCLGVVGEHSMPVEQQQASCCFSRRWRRMIQVDTKPVADARPLWRRLLSRPAPQQPAPPPGAPAAAGPANGNGGSGSGSILSRVFGGRTSAGPSTAQYTSDPASLGSLAGVMPASGSAGDASCTASVLCTCSARPCTSERLRVRVQRLVAFMAAFLVAFPHVLCLLDCSMAVL